MSEKFDVEVINDLCIVVRQRYGENAVEALVGALSSLSTYIIKIFRRLEIPIKNIFI